MHVRVNIQKEAAPALRQMAHEAGIGIHDMVEVAVYNLIALWQRDRGIGTQPLDATDALDGGK